MPWFYVDDAFADSKPVMRIDAHIRNEAVGLWVRCGAWSAKEETDGVVPTAVLRQFGATTRLVDALINASELWENEEIFDKNWRDSRQILFKNWSKWQKTHAENAARRKREADKKATYRSQKKGRDYVTTSDDTKLSTGDMPVDSSRDSKYVSTGDSPGVSTGESLYPDPTLKDKDKRKDLNTCATASREHPSRFADFWAAYPRRRDRRKAEKAFASALKRAPPDEIISGALRYATDPNREDRYTKYAEGWLNGDGWLDEPLPSRNGNHTPHKLRTLAELAQRVRAEEQAQLATPSRKELA